MQQAASMPFAPVRIEKDHSAMTVAGFDQRFEASGDAGIPALWRRLGPLLGGIPGQTGDAAYGVMCDFTQVPFGYRYLAGVEISGQPQLPEDFSTFLIPAGNYAVFEHSGHIATLKTSCEAIWSRGLPRSGLLPVEGGAWFEKYDASYDPATGLGVVEIWIPVQEGEMR